MISVHTIQMMVVDPIRLGLPGDELVDVVTTIELLENGSQKPNLPFPVPVRNQ
jgi:hypothetical protein